MLQAIRKREKLLLTIFVTLIAIVFVFWGFYGDFNIQNIGGNDVASVNGEKITIQDFQSEYQNTLRFYENILKNKLTPEMLERFNVQQMVLNQLIDQKLIVQGAKSLGLKVTDKEVLDSIIQTPAFQKNGTFDKEQYLNLLKANRLNPSGYETNIRLGLLQRKILNMIRNYIAVSDDEVYKDYLLKNTQMNVEFVTVNPALLISKVQIQPTEISDFLNSKDSLKRAQTHYANNPHLFKIKEKIKSFDEVKHDIVRTLLQEQKTENLAKELIDQLWKNKDSFEFKRLLSTEKLKWEETGFFAVTSRFVPKVGESHELIEALLKTKKKSFLSRYFIINRQYYIVKLKDQKEANPKTFEKDKTKLVSDYLNQKQSDAYYEWLKEIKSTARISIKKNLSN